VKIHCALYLLCLNLSWYVVGIASECFSCGSSGFCRVVIGKEKASQELLL
jgi:hypothetical protein